MTLTQSEIHGAHVHYIASSLYLFPGSRYIAWVADTALNNNINLTKKLTFPGNLDLCDTRIYPDSAVLFSSLFTTCFLMSLMWRIPISSHILTRFWSLFGLCHFCCTSESKSHRGITLSIICLSVRLSACLFVTLCFCWHQMRSAEHCSFVDLSDFNTFSSPVVHYGAILWCGLAEIRR